MAKEKSRHTAEVFLHAYSYTAAKGGSRLKCLCRFMRDLKRKEEREISLDCLMSEKYFEYSAMDSYFEKQDKPTIFLVLGKEVIVNDERLATALSRLPQLRREVLLLYYFIGYRDKAIGRLYGHCRSTITG